jgi:hypothetical protein
LARVSVGAKPTGRAIEPGFLGLSFEYPAVSFYTGADPHAINPVLVQLIRNLNPGQAPVLRIGGDTTDTSWWPVRDLPRPQWVAYTLTPAWVKTTRALADRLGARLILGINLAADSTAIASTEARALISGIGRSRIEALELGNEPEVYGQIPWYRDDAGTLVYSRPSWYWSGGLRAYATDFSAMRAVLPHVPLAGPAVGGRRQLADLASFLQAEPGLSIVTFHRYPLNRCFTTPDSPQAATLANLLQARASRGLMSGIAGYVALAHRRGAQFRVDEVGSVACGGKLGVSDTFGSALWAIDTMFAMAQAGVDGVNVHTFPGARYSLFAVSHRNGRWQALVHPEYYGLLLFARAAPPGSRLLPALVADPGDLRVWAVRAPRGSVRVVLINDSTTLNRPVALRFRGASGTASLARLQAPNVGSKVGVTLAGQTFGPATRTGTLTGARQATPLRPSRDEYHLMIPAASAALLTIPAAR